MLWCRQRAGGEDLMPEDVAAAAAGGEDLMPADVAAATDVRLTMAAPVREMNK